MLVVALLLLQSFMLEQVGLETPWSSQDSFVLLSLSLSLSLSPYIYLFFAYFSPLYLWFHLLSSFLLPTPSSVPFFSFIISFLFALWCFFYLVIVDCCSASSISLSFPRSNPFFLYLLFQYASTEYNRHSKPILCLVFLDPFLWPPDLQAFVAVQNQIAEMRKRMRSLPSTAPTVEEREPGRSSLSTIDAHAQQASQTSTLGTSTFSVKQQERQSQFSPLDIMKAHVSSAAAVVDPSSRMMLAQSGYFPSPYPGANQFPQQFLPQQSAFNSSSLGLHPSALNPTLGPLMFNSALACQPYTSVIDYAGYIPPQQHFRTPSSAGIYAASPGMATPNGIAPSTVSAALPPAGFAREGNMVMRAPPSSTSGTGPSADSVYMVQYPLWQALPPANYMALMPTLYGGTGVGSNCAPLVPTASRQSNTSGPMPPGCP